MADDVIHIGGDSPEPTAEGALPPVPSDEVAELATGLMIPSTDPVKSTLLIRRLANQVQNQQYLINQLRFAQHAQSDANVEKRNELEKLAESKG